MYAVIFDMDGVIFDTENLGRYAWRQAAPFFGIDNIDEVYSKIIGTKYERGLEILRENFGADFPAEDFRKKAGTFVREVLETKIPIKPFVPELLTFLKENGIKTALASSTKYEIVLRELKQEGLIDYFDVIIGGDLVTRSKPEPDIFLKAIKSIIKRHIQILTIIYHKALIINLINLFNILLDNNTLLVYLLEGTLKFFFIIADVNI